MTTIRRNRVPEHRAVDTGSATPGSAGTPPRRDGAADPVRVAPSTPRPPDDVGRGMVAPDPQPQ